jgi:protoporphyrinogen IX oxidase
MISFYRVLLSIHLIAIISWMAGLLYLYRLFVYHAEETEAVVKARFSVMEKRLYKIITIPAMLLALAMGISMIVYNPNILKYPWMHAKLLFVFLMIGVTHVAKKFQRELENNTCKVTAKTFRILNEVPTLLMILIILLVILQPF